MENQKLMAFWKYDLFPYMLCGEIERFNDNGTIVPKGYNRMSFKPIAIIPGMAGEGAAEKLGRVREEYDINQKALKNTYAKKAKQIIERV